MMDCLGSELTENAWSDPLVVSPLTYKATQLSANYLDFARVHFRILHAFMARSRPLTQRIPRLMGGTKESWGRRIAESIITTHFPFTWCGVVYRPRRSNE